MPSKLHISSLITVGLAIDCVAEAKDVLVVTARTKLAKVCARSAEQHPAASTVNVDRPASMIQSEALPLQFHCDKRACRVVADWEGGEELDDRRIGLPAARL